jgi:hypothetical protein
MIYVMIDRNAQPSGLSIADLLSKSSTPPILCLAHRLKAPFEPVGPPINDDVPPGHLHRSLVCASDVVDCLCR